MENPFDIVPVAPLPSWKQLRDKSMDALSTGKSHIAKTDECQSVETAHPGFQLQVAKPINGKRNSNE
jgi:hypothetical protein